MASNKKPRKAYKPKFCVMPITMGIDPDAKRAIAMIPYLELKNLAEGGQDETHWHTIASRLNVGAVLALSHYTQDAQDAMRDALDVLRNIWRRHESVGKWGASKAEIGEINDALVLIDEMDKTTTRREQRAAVMHVWNTACI